MNVRNPIPFALVAGLVATAPVQAADPDAAGDARAPSPIVVARTGKSGGASAEEERRAACPWVPLFDGHSLDGWTPKFRGFAYGEDPADTFRVEDGAITVSYDGYEEFGGRFGHLFYETPFSHYRLRLEYRIYGDAIPGTPVWAFRNSGVMYHALPPDTMPVEQEFPVSLEMQFLRGRGDGEPRPTGNVCTPNTNTVYQGKFDETHCISSSSPTFDDDGWVTAELLVLGDELVVHRINGEDVLRFERPTYGGPGQAVHNLDPAQEGEPVVGGYIAVQAEGHPVQFRNIDIQVLAVDASSSPDCARPGTAPTAPASR